MTDLEDKIAAIIKETYDATGFEDEGRSDQAAHDIVVMLKEWGWRPDDWPEPGPNSVFKPHTTTSVSMDNLWVEIVTPEPDPKP